MPLLPLPKEGHGSLSYWKDQIQTAEDKRKTYQEGDWDRNVQSYLGKTLSSRPEFDTVTVPKDFSNVERKKAELFFQNPEINLTPRLPGLDDAVNIFQAVLNHYLGPNGVDASTMMTEVTFDCQMTGLLVTKIGYENFDAGAQSVQTGERPVEGPPPQVPGAVLGLSEPPPQMEPIMGQMPNIVHERYFWQRVSPAAVLIPPNFTGFNYDRAPWLGFTFEDDWEVIKRRYDLSDDFDRAVGHPDKVGLKSEKPEDSTVQTHRVKGYEIWYRASLYDADVVHPEQLRYLVLLDGIDESVRHMDSPYQTNQNGKIEGMLGFPVHIGALRYVSDTAYPVPETTMGRPQTSELGRGRTQMLNQRDRNTPMRWADPGRIGGEPTMEKLRRNVWQAVIPIPGADANNLPLGEIPRAHFPPEDFQFDSIINRDLDEIWGFGANQRGQETGGRTTATEIRNISSNVSSRMDYERRQVIKFFVAGVEKLGALIQKFADDQDFIQIVGQDGIKRLQPWNKQTIAGRFAYSARPDSSARVDAAQEFKDLVELYNLSAKDNRTERGELLTRIARLKNLDPSRFVKPEPPPPQPQAPPPSVGITLRGEDINPLNPAFPIVMEILKQGGIQISPQAIQQAQQSAQQDLDVATQQQEAQQQQAQPGQPEPHGGAAPQADRISQHQSERSGQLTGPPTGGSIG
jgi:hypothetical protein